MDILAETRELLLECLVGGANNGLDLEVDSVRAPARGEAKRENKGKSDDETACEFFFRSRVATYPSIVTLLSCHINDMYHTYQQ